MTGLALFNALLEFDAADSDRLQVRLVAGGAFEVVFLFEFGLILEALFERG